MMMMIIMIIIVIIIVFIFQWWRKVFCFYQLLSFLKEFQYKFL